MNSTNYGQGSSSSKRYWLEQTRTFIARALLRSSLSYGRLAERLAVGIAPWIANGEGKP